MLLAIKFTRKESLSIFLMAKEASEGMFGESLMIFGRDLLNQPQSKKIMIILSDGYPQVTARGADSDVLKQSVNYLENQGLILGSIGIKSDAPKYFYKNNTLINKLDQLPGALSELCGKLIKEKD